MPRGNQWKQLAWLWKLRPLLWFVQQCSPLKAFQWSLHLSLSVCHPVVGRGERRGAADLLPDGNRVEEDPRLVRLLHLRHHRQHRHPLHPAEGGVTMFLTVLQKRRKKKKNGEKNTRIRPNTTDCEQKWACLVAIRTLKPPLITLFSQKFTFPLHSFHVRADTSQALQRSITDIYSLFCRIKRSEKMQIHVFVDKTHQRFLWSNKERHIKNLKNQRLWLSGLLRQIVWSINP